ncbi:putative tetratricopeptide-like helical domain superfamily [Helianthus anomalus]
MRLQRHKMGADDFEPLTMIGKGALGEVVACIYQTDYRQQLMMHAHQLFDEMSERNNVSWNVMISGYAATGDLVVAEKLFRNAPVKCVVVWTAMVMGYMKSRKVDLADKMFDGMPERNLVTRQVRLVTFNSLTSMQP